MEDTEPSRLRGAYDNYIKSKDYFRQNIPRKTGKCVSERCFCSIFIFILFCSIGLYGIALISYYSKDYFSLFATLAGFFVILVIFALILIHKCDPCQHIALHNATEEQTANQLDAEHTSEEQIAYQPAALRHRSFGLGRILCYLRSCCPTVSTEDRRNQTEEYIAYHPTALHNETDEQTAAQHDTGEEEIVYRPAVLRHRFFRLGRIFCCPRQCYPTVSTEDLQNQTEEYATCQLAAQHDAAEEQIFCCPRQCYPTVSTEDLQNQTEEYATCQLAAQHAAEEQTINQLDRIPVQTAAEVLQPSSSASSEEVSTKLQMEEQRLLQYLLGSTEEQESDSNE